MGCGCGKKALVSSTTAEAEAMIASGGGGTFRYEVVSIPDSSEDQRFTSYVAAKSFQRKNGGKIQALDY